MAEIAAGVAGGVAFLALTKWYCNGGVNKFKPDLSNKIIVVTGANTGLGFESVKAMALLKPEKIILACRNIERGTTAVNKIKNDLKF